MLKSQLAGGWPVGYLQSVEELNREQLNTNPSSGREEGLNPGPPIFLGIRMANFWQQFLKRLMRKTHDLGRLGAWTNIQSFNPEIFAKYLLLVYTTQVSSAFRARWSASSEVISQVLFNSEQPKENKMAFLAVFWQIKLLFGPLVIQLVWYILKQLFTSVSVKVVDIYLAASQLGKYPPLFTSISVNNC